MTSKKKITSRDVRQEKIIYLKDKISRRFEYK
jgi:hypothetical protein